MSLKVICDRCGRSKEIADKTQRSFGINRMSIFHTPRKRKIKDVDLCHECRIELREFMDMAESYFMNNKDDVIDIFEKSKYYRE